MAVGDIKGLKENVGGTFDEILIPYIDRGSISLTTGQHTISLTNTVENINYIPHCEGYILGTEEEVGTKIIRNSKTVTGFDVDVTNNCVVDWFIIKY